jgi:glycerol-3-phosphate dehydrogenase
MKGTTLANYTEFKQFSYDKDGKVNGGKVKDTLSGKEFGVKAKVVVNCSGIHSDKIRKLADPTAPDRMLCARGAHLMFNKEFMDPGTSIIIPQTTDGRLIFVISYNGRTMAGTTDVECEPTFNPTTSEEDIKFIIENVE